MAPGHGFFPVWLAHGYRGAGSARRAGRNPVHHRHFRNGGVLRQQTPPRIGNSHGPRRAAQGSVRDSSGTRPQVACVWLRRRIATRNFGQPCPGFHRVPSDSPRSAGLGWFCSGYVIARAAGHLDSRATRAVDRSRNPPPRGVNCLPAYRESPIDALDVQKYTVSRYALAHDGVTMAQDQLTASPNSNGARKVERTANPSRPVVYVNNTVVENSQVDVQLYFSFVHEVTPGKFASVEQLLVVMAPEHALQLSKALQKTLESYEAAHGKIREIKLEQPPAGKKFLE